MTDKVIISKIFTRDFSLILCQIWGRRYKNFFGKDIKIFPKNIYIFKNGAFDVYRHPQLNYEINSVILEKLKENSNFINDKTEEYINKIKKLIDYSIEEISSKNDFFNFLNLLLDYWHGIFINQYVPLDERYIKNDKNIALKFRKKVDVRQYQLFNFIDSALEKLYPDIAIRRLISLEELENNTINKEVLENRFQKGFVVVDDLVMNMEDFEKLKKEFNFEIESFDNLENITEIKGQIACDGKISGMVKIVSKKSDLNKVQKGDILVSPMTIPDFLPAMKKAIAFVTDEGGITCHAAIVAREMKKPCIIGTKIATKVLKDGDIVEVDANKGVVKMLKKA